MARRFLRLGLLLFVGLLLLAGAVWFWYNHRPIPEALEQTLFEGVSYVRDVRREPRPLIIHVIAVELDAPGVSFLVTPGDPDQELPLRARKTSQFLTEFGVQVAVNGDFFSPWHSNSPWDYYPHVGDAVVPKGFASSRGTVYSEIKDKKRPTLYLSRENRASFEEPLGELYNAISGDRWLVKGGFVVEQPAPAYYNSLHPRTALALDQDARRLIIVVVDGRQPNYSEGVTMLELSEIILAYKGHTAINLDGGGSTTLVMEGASGEPTLLNSPIDNRIPGRERPVGNHLGVFAPKSP